MAASEVKLVTAEEFRGYDKARMIEAESSFRKQIADARMDIYGQRADLANKTSVIRKNLARLLTVKTATMRATAPKAKAAPVAAAPKAAKPAAKAKAAKPAAAKKPAEAKAPKTKKAGK